MAHITVEKVKLIRNSLKTKFPNIKFSVRRDDYIAVNIALISGDINFYDGSLDDEKDNYVFNGYLCINEYHLELYGKHQLLLSQILEIAKSCGWYDKSDSQIDYFDIAYYIDISIGKWDKKYKYIPKKGV